MKWGLWLPIGGTALGFTVMLGAFLTNSNPYTTVDGARAAPGKVVHLAGDIVQGTIQTDPRRGQVRFVLRDEKSRTVPVVYTGLQPANMGSVTKVVAIGSYREGHFLAHKLLVKCPSKYEGEKIEAGSTT